MTFLAIPKGLLTVRSVNCKVIGVGFKISMPNFLKRVKGINEMLAPESHNSFSSFLSPTFQGIMKVPRSLILVCKLC